MGSRPRDSIRAGQARSVKSLPISQRKQRPRKRLTLRAAASLLSALRRKSKSISTELPRVSPTQEIREMRGGVPVTALRHIRAGLERARFATIACASILNAQAADYDGDVALTLRRCVSVELFHQIQRINGLLAEAEADGGAS